MRVFVAADVTNDAVKARIGAFQQDIRDMGKAVELRNLHFTLQFLGEVSQEAAGAAAEALKSVKFNPFNVELRGAGTFGRPPRIVWAGTDMQGGQGLSDLAGTVGKALGCGDGKPFKPHLTILRVKKRRIDVSRYTDHIWGMQRIDTIKLKKSVLKNTGPTYTNIAEVAAE